MSVKKKFVIVFIVLFPMILQAKEGLHYTYLWHLEQPIYWPAPDNTGLHYQRALESIQAKKNGAPHPQNDLDEIFSKDDRVAAYQWRPKDSLSTLLSYSEAGVQVSYSGGLIENVQSLGSVNMFGYSGKWNSSFKEAQAWNTTKGKTRMDIVVFPFHHPLLPLIDSRVASMEIKVYKEAYPEAWKSGSGSKGLFPPEIAFSERIIPVLVENGIQWVIVSNAHISRACENYPFIPGSGGDNIPPPNKADLLNPAQKNFNRIFIDRGVSPANAYPYSYVPHYAHYIDPSTGLEHKIIVVPAAQSESWKDGYSCYGLDEAGEYASTGDAEHPVLVVMAHDGDNAFGGGYSYYMECVPNLASIGQGKGYIPTVVEQYLADHPVDTSDIVHVEDGAWVNADGDFGSPSFLNWNWPLMNKQGEVDIENGWAEDERNHAVIAAAENYVLTAEDIAGPSSPSKILHPESGADPLELAWHFLLGSLNSGYMYYGKILDMELKPVVACNEAVKFAKQALANSENDKTSPTMFPPQHYPDNPGGTNFGPLYKYKMVEFSPDTWFWTFAFDVSGIKSVNFNYRTDKDGKNSLLTTDNETYSGGSDVGSWISMPMAKRIFPKGNVMNDPEIDTSILPEYIADEYYVQVTGLKDVLIDYYIEAEDEKGNTGKSPIQHLYIGASSGTAGSVKWKPKYPCPEDSITVFTDKEGMLHWGVNGWKQPPEKYFTEGTVIWGDGKSVESPMKKCDDGFCVSIGPFESDVMKVDFVFHFKDGKWDNNSGSDYHILISPCEEPVEEKEDALIEDTASAEEISVFPEESDCSEILEDTVIQDIEAGEDTNIEKDSGSQDVSDVQKELPGEISGELPEENDADIIYDSIKIKDIVQTDAVEKKGSGGCAMLPQAENTYFSLLLLLFLLIFLQFIIKLQANPEVFMKKILFNFLLLQIFLFFILSCGAGEGKDAQTDLIPDSAADSAQDAVPEEKDNAADFEAAEIFPVDTGIDSIKEIGEILPEIPDKEISVQCEKDEDCDKILIDLEMCKKPVCNKESGKCEIGNSDNGTKCDDGKFCTKIDLCKDGVCAGDFDTCDDKNECTEDSCDEEHAKCENIEDPDKCDDNDKCTKDFCYPATGECLYEPSGEPGCCKENSDCDDKNLCTIDTCADEGKCENKKPPTLTCCTYDYECDDKDPCTKDVCAVEFNVCTHEQILGGDCCTPDCTEKNCGSDGCGGSCGTCKEGYCGSDFKCTLTCEPTCEGKKCGQNGCGESCGACSVGEICSNDGTCAKCGATACTAIECGSDGCGGWCSKCGDFDNCSADGKCVDACEKCPIKDDCLNIDFESGSLSGFKILGDVGIVKKLGVTGSPEGMNMLLMSNGVYVNDNGTLELDICLPSYIKRIVVMWKLYSEEFKEWCGSSFQDSFQVKLTGMKGGEIKAVDVTIDALCDAADCSGCGKSYVGLTKSDVQLDQGDAYTTPWVKTEVDISTLLEEGPVVKLEVHVNDIGDNIYNTAVLIDYIKLLGPKSCTTETEVKDCDDNNQCTKDTCAEKKCVYEKIEECCKWDMECDDSDKCTKDVCENNICAHKDICCEKDNECNDNKLCTEDKCGADKFCLNSPIKGCCEKTEDCNDNDPCTTDKCEDNKCSNDKIPECCVYNFDCDDSDQCTEDSCKDSKCVHKNICCEKNEDCDDKDLCTEDTCGVDKFCDNTWIEGCCQTDTDCNDYEPCTEDKCPVPGEKCEFVKIENCCFENSDCKDGKACTQDLCKNNKCTSDEQYCCSTKEQCSDGETQCTSDDCMDGFCIHKPAENSGCCKTMILGENFDSGDKGNFTLSPPVNSVGWNYVTGKKYVSADGSLYYGNPQKGNFNNGNKNSGTATSIPINIPSGVEITFDFRIYMDTETATTYDFLSIYLLQEGGKKYPLWDKSSLKEYKKFAAVSVNLSAFGGMTGSIVLSFDTMDQIANDGEGVYIDDFSITSTCKEKSCETDADCSDGMPFTLDGCINKTCQHIVAAVECYSNADCDDKNSDTYDYCQNYTCIHEEYWY